MGRIFESSMHSLVLWKNILLLKNYLLEKSNKILTFFYHYFLRRNVDIQDVGNSALYLLSDLAGGVTGEIHYVDAGYNKVGMPDPKNIT